MKEYQNNEAGRALALAAVNGDQSKLWFDGEHIRVFEGGVESPRIITTSEYIDRFTPAEQLAITSLAYSGAGDAQVVLLLLKTQTRAEINLDSAVLIAGLDYLVSKGAIAAGRPAIIRA